MPPDATTPILRPARLDDAEAIRAIYNYEVETGTAVFDLQPRSSQAQREWLTDRSGAHAVIVAEVDGVVTGFASLSRYKERAAYSTTVENSVYVGAQYRDRGLGRLLLEEIVAVAERHGFHTVIARITAENRASVVLHERVGFETIGIEREVGRKHGRWLDVVAMQKML